jgi:hypothetical protein
LSDSDLDEDEAGRLGPDLHGPKRLEASNSQFFLFSVLKSYMNT